MIFNLKKLNQRGFDHAMLVVAFVVLFAGVGTFLLVASHAATPGPRTLLVYYSKSNDTCLNLAHGYATVAACSYSNAAQGYRFNASHEIILNGGCLVPNGASRNSLGVGTDLHDISNCSSVPWGGAWTMSGKASSGYEFKNNHTGGKYCMDLSRSGSGQVYLGGCGDRWFPETESSTTGSGALG